MARCEDFPCCGHEPGCCPDYDESGRQLNMKCTCGATVPINSRYSLCETCLNRPDPDDPNAWDDRDFDDRDDDFDDDLDDEEFNDHQDQVDSRAEDDWLDSRYEEQFELPEMDNW